MSKFIKIIIVGDPGVGKSCLAANIVDRQISSIYIPTKEPIKSSTELNKYNQVLNIEIWDMPGDDQYITLSSSHYKGAHGAIIVYSVTNKESLCNVNHWIENVNDVLSEAPNLTKFVVGLKVDKVAAVSSQAGESKAALFDCRHFHCTNNDKKTVKMMFEELLNQILEMNGLLPNENQKEITKSCKCC
ncbi:uncharacterized protein LOC105847701 isoform X2 [Hydra vulgaris]|uniref:Uncharacterized protein LOC105847701 isoform X2 n=1 Tax=Hydra vulgaris TaxID=6087 RepID=A0ABM4CGP1_HYDVU